MRTLLAFLLALLLPLAHAGEVIPFPGARRPAPESPAAPPPAACEPMLTFRKITELPRAQRLAYSLQSVIVERTKHREWEGQDLATVRFHAEAAESFKFLLPKGKDTVVINIGDNGFFVAIQVSRDTEGLDYSDTLELMRRFSDELLDADRAGLNIYFGQIIRPARLERYREITKGSMLAMGYSVSSELDTAAYTLEKALAAMPSLKPVNGVKIDGDMNLYPKDGEPGLIWKSVRLTLRASEPSASDLLPLIRKIEEIAKGHLRLPPVE